MSVRRQWCVTDDVLSLSLRWRYQDEWGSERRKTRYPESSLLFPPLDPAPQEEVPRPVTYVSGRPLFDFWDTSEHHREFGSPPDLESQRDSLVGFPSLKHISSCGWSTEHSENKSNWTRDSQPIIIGIKEDLVHVKSLSTVDGVWYLNHPPSHVKYLVRPTEVGNQEVGNHPLSSAGRVTIIWNTRSWFFMFSWGIVGRKTRGVDWWTTSNSKKEKFF